MLCIYYVVRDVYAGAISNMIHLDDPHIANSTKTEKTTLATPLAIGSEDEHTEVISL